VIWRLLLTRNDLLYGLSASSYTCRDRLAAKFAISFGHHRGAPGMLITRRSAIEAIMAALALGPVKGHAEMVALNVHLKQHIEDLDTLLKFGVIRMLVPTFLHR
jgi:hypothetical protein